jgi:hypothetical protein
MGRFNSLDDEHEADRTKARIARELRTLQAAMQRVDDPQAIAARIIRYHAKNDPLAPRQAASELGWWKRMCLRIL